MIVAIKQLSVFPSVPKEKHVIDKNGNMTAIWQLYFQQLDTALQNNFGAEGLVIPTQNSDNIDFNTALSLSTPGTALYDSATQTIKIAVPSGDTPTPPNLPTVVWKTLTPV